MELEKTIKESFAGIADQYVRRILESKTEKELHNKTNYTKLTKTKLSERFNEVKSIGEVIDRMTIKMRPHVDVPLQENK